jgi:hypothetical protein
MKVVNMGSTLRIFPDDLTVTDSIPVGTYQIQFSNMSGYSLTKIKDFHHEGKVYGDHLQLVDKIVSRYQMTDKNFGTILGGRKGTGKSMTARIISERLMELGLPTIIVTENTPGLSGFLQSIEQPVFILIDEFEKIFTYDNENDEQSQFLSVFDGFHHNNHFYLITINDYKKLNEYFRGRTGRFYYDIKFGKMSIDEIDGYIRDCVEPEYISDGLISLLYRLGTNYDQLGAIARELNLGESIENIIKYLNLGLIDSRRDQYEATFTFSTGVTTKRTFTIDLLYPNAHMRIDENFRTKQGEINYDFSFEVPGTAFTFDGDNLAFDLNKIGKVFDTNEGYEPSQGDTIIYRPFSDLVSVTLSPYAQKLAY